MKKYLKVILSIFLCVGIIGIGRAHYLKRRDEQRAVELLAAERQSVKVLKEKFADIKEVKVEHFEKNHTTGTYGALVTMTNTEGKAVYFDYFYTTQANKIGSYGLEDVEVQKEGRTTSTIKVIYMNGEVAYI
ncbi:hypothetical protein BH747_04830 [Enterococcus villorum]|uniref:DUF1310 domain-containing protein n=1 Tax=Enterococcus villorum TaxID=112904 RepID=A0A1V8YVA6_9ENTE|nr:hypothetical protein [Enterococcus villorum]OQO70731.1 hypothetical protein BH747_04830 [Enterococcus villorum]OQO76563.1 hypothetical protein BH744_02890 [Enterococcus villorum]